MLRLIGVLLLVVSTSRAELPAAPPLTPLPLFTQAGPALARGALVWLHGTYDKDAPGPPDPPELVGRMAGRVLDVFQFLRSRGNDPLVGSGEGLARGLAALRAGGYRRIVVAGHSRGAWIALTALAHPGLADSIVAVSVAAHGTRPERQIQARADWQALWASASAAPTRVVLVQLGDDPYDPDPHWQLDVAKAGAERAGLRLLPIFLPPVPRGHLGFYKSEFDETLGAVIADFADPR